MEKQHWSFRSPGASRVSVYIAHTVPRKGLSHEHGVDQMCKDIEHLGHKDIVLKADNEPAMRTFQEEIKTRRRDNIISETSPVGESQSNGEIEGTVKIIQGKFRSIKSSTEQRLREKIKRE